MVPRGEADVTHPRLLGHPAEVFGPVCFWVEAGFPFFQVMVQLDGIPRIGFPSLGMLVVVPFPASEGAIEAEVDEEAVA